MLLITVLTPADKRAEIAELVNIFDGKIVNVGFDQMIIMLADPPEKLDDFEDLLRPYGIVEVQRTGQPNAFSDTEMLSPAHTVRQRISDNPAPAAAIAPSNRRFASICANVAAPCDGAPRAVRLVGGASHTIVVRPANAARS